ncbi:MAG: hypothetical protein AABM64_06620 [Pseudomonadota bacterium]
MITKSSRYEKAVQFRTEPTDPRPFRGIRPRAIGPARGVLEHSLREGERHDWLAAHYYNEQRLWWRILDANPDVLYAGDLARRDAADPLLIPRPVEPGTR